MNQATSGRAASFGGVQATRRGNHRRICRSGPPALTAWKRYRCMAALVPVLRAADGTATTHIQSARISQLVRADEVDGGLSRLRELKPSSSRCPLAALWRLKGLPDGLAAASLPTQPPLQLRLPRQ